MTLRVAGYVRVSTQDQVEHGLNLDEDRRRIREKCEAEGWELVAVFDDGGLQGDDPNRPELLAMLGALDRIDVVVLRSIDRLARDPMILGLATNAFRAAGVRLESFATGPIDIETPQGEFTSSLFAAMGKFEKRLTGQRVKQAMRARIRAGLMPGGIAPYGYAWAEKALIVVAEQSEVVLRIFTDYAGGFSQRGIARALNEAGIPTPHGGMWRQSAITRILSNVVYTGKLSVTEEDGERVVIPGAHEPIVNDDLWNRVQTIRTGVTRRKGGRHADGGHLLVRGVLRCGHCSSAMIPRKARPGTNRAAYVCAGRVEHGRDFCDQPSIRRELVDEPFLSNLLDHYIDLDATRRRGQERAASMLANAREAVQHTEAEAQRTKSRLARVQRGWQDGVLDDDDYGQQRADLLAERQAASAAVERARAHVEAVERDEAAQDADGALLKRLAAVKRTVAEDVGKALDLIALRNLIGELFEAVELVRWPGFGTVQEGLASNAPGPDPVNDGEQTYALLPMLRWSAVDSETFSPTGQAMPVGSMPQYPPSEPKPLFSR